MNPDPLIVTELPPEVGPAFGLTPVTLGWKSNPNVKSKPKPLAVLDLHPSVASRLGRCFRNDLVGRDEAHERRGRSPKNTLVPPLTKPPPRMFTNVPPLLGPTDGKAETAKGMSKVSATIPVLQPSDP